MTPSSIERDLFDISSFRCVYIYMTLKSITLKKEKKNQPTMEKRLVQLCGFRFDLIG